MYGVGSGSEPAVGMRSKRAQWAAWMKLRRRIGALTNALRSDPGQVRRSHQDQGRRTGVMTVIGEIAGVPRGAVMPPR